jgi:glycosyl hydrolase family 95
VKTTDHTETPYSRRAFLSTGLAAPLVAGQPAPASESGRAGGSSLLDVDYARLVSRADLTYEKPATRSEEGIPIGNGRMGSLVWTTPAALRFQINRVDVYANDSYTNSFFERHTDYCGGCAFVDLNFGDSKGDVFPASGFSQHLSLYDALLTVQGTGVTARILAWHEQDVMALEIDDRRQTPQQVSVSLRMLRYLSQYFGEQLESFARDHVVQVRTRSHTAASRLIIRDDRIVLTQEFREGEYYNKSAVAVGLSGRSAYARLANETEVRLSARSGGGPLTCLIASAASFDPEEDVAATALRQLDAATARGFSGLYQDNKRWWNRFWSRGFVHLRSDDGEADYVEQNYNYFLYLMASSSRGKLPPKFNGMIWNTGGDLRSWGGQHWFANLSCYYEALPASNNFELMDPAFDMYSGMYEASAAAARQQWGSQGIFIPETTWFNGLAGLPEDIAEEMRDLYLLRKPWEQRSSRFKEFSSTRHPHSSRWNWYQGGRWIEGRWVTTEKGSGAFGHVVHILGTTAKVAYLFWRRYEYTLDRRWLQERAYPMLKGATEFYRHFPNVKKGADGKYHIHHVNSNESVLGARDTDEDTSAMRAVLAATIRASEILGVDAALRLSWNEFVENLAPLPVSDDPAALKPEGYEGPRVWVRGLHPAVKAGRGFLPDPNSLPMWFFDLCPLESDDRERLQTANATFSAYFRNGISSRTPVSVLSKLAIAAATLGRADAVRFMIPNQMRVLRQERETAYRGGGVLANRLTLREGPQALDAQRLGRASEALHLALLQSNPPAPARDPVIRVFPAWPKQWDAEYTLLARGGFLVTSSIKGGRIEFVELESLAGAECKLRNPWNEGTVSLYRNGKKSQTLSGALLTLPTHKGERLVLVPGNTTPDEFRRSILS